MKRNKRKTRPATHGPKVLVVRQNPPRDPHGLTHAAPQRICPVCSNRIEHVSSVWKHLRSQCPDIDYTQRIYGMPDDINDG